MRTIIELPVDQLDALADLCQSEGISRAEAIRRAIAEYMRGRRAKDVTAAFGLWRNRAPDGLEYERTLRDDWERATRTFSAHVAQTSMKALFDTNILIDYLKGVEAARAEFDRYTQRLISVVTWMDVLVGPRNAAEDEVIEMFMRDFRVVDLTRAVARGAVEIRRAQKIRLPDAIIWSSARAESALLVTRNTKDFPSSEPGIRIPY